MRPVLRHPFFWALSAALLLHGLLPLIHWQPAPPPVWQSIREPVMDVLLEDWPDTPVVDADAVEAPQEPDMAPDAPSTEALQPADAASEPDDEPVMASQETVADPEPAPEMDEVVAPTGSLLARSLEIARLESELLAQQSAQANRPRIRRISSGARMSSEEALYLKQWEERVERIGNLNYPEEARRQNLGGRLRLLVVINANGDILEAQLLTGSGHRLLDDAAIRILNLSAPFAPLPESIRAQADVLEIIRTWQFGDGWHAN